MSKRGEYHKHDTNGRTEHVDTDSSDGKRVIHEINRYCTCGELVMTAPNGSTMK